jgi:hypothetical protein
MNMMSRVVGETKKGEAPKPRPEIAVGRLVLGGFSDRRDGHDMHAATMLVELHVAFGQSVESPVAADSDIHASVKFGTPLPDDDSPRADRFAAKPFNTESLSVAVSSVSDASLTFFMRHMFAPLKN